jgi:Ca-activated chloride channel family protein
VRGLFCGLVLLAVGACGACSTNSPKSGADKDKPSFARPEPADVKEMREAKRKATEQPHNTEAYERIIDNPFLSAERNPLSTFAADVSTASYSNVRRFLFDEHRLPPPDAVRVAELVNYFPYRYPEPDDGAPVRFTVDLAECPWNAKHHLVRVGMQARRIDPTQMPPRNFVFLIDTSGSMNASNRLPLLVDSLNLLVDQLTAKDRVAIVTYAGSAGLELPSTPGDQKATIRAALRRLHASGSTNGGEGIVLAYRLAEENFIRGGLNRVILGTDGDFNVGVTSPGDLTRLIDEKRQSGVFLTILGFGMGNLKDATMEQLAYHGNGHYAYIDTIDEARKVFIEQGAALVTVAKDVKLQVEFNPRRVGAYRLIGYENRLLRNEDFNDDSKNAGAMGAGHTVTALYEIVPAGQPINLPNVDPLRYQSATKPDASDKEWLFVKMRYKDPESEKSELIQYALRDGVRKMSETSEDFRFTAAVAEFGLLLRDSEYKADANYARVRETARAARGVDAHGRRAEFLQLVDTAAQLARRQ